MKTRYNIEKKIVRLTLRRNEAFQEAFLPFKFSIHASGTPDLKKKCINK